MKVSSYLEKTKRLKAKEQEVVTIKGIGNSFHKV
jgi:hypothetical protein